MESGLEHHMERTKYALDLIAKVPSYEEFIFEMMDRFGTEEVRPYLGIYQSLISMPGWPDEIKKEFCFGPFDEPERLISKFYHWCDVREQKRQIKENIDQLQFHIEAYRQSDEYRMMRDFIGRFKYLAPYNAMMVDMQRPGAKLVLRASDWQKRHNRKIRPNAQKLIVLVPFGPIECMYDIEDTEPIGDQLISDDKIIQGYQEIYDAKGKVTDELYKVFMDNLALAGILVDENFAAANTFAGYIRLYKEGKVDVPISKDARIKWHSHYLLSVNRNESLETRFATICHELGHLFCRHLSFFGKEARDLTHREKEFEAETVSWLVCKRAGIHSPSEKYLVDYTKEGELPFYSIDQILTAVTEIETLLHGKLPVSKSLLYKHDKEFKTRIDKSKAPKQLKLNL